MDNIRFSDTGEFLAVASKDGRLRIWETSSSRVKQEFIPSSHLSATCTCLEWSASSTSSGTSSKKAKKVKKAASVEETVVMGNAVGSLLFYGVAKAQLLASTEIAHTGKVTGLSWCSSTSHLFSCGQDGYIIEWNPETTSVVSRWRGNKTGLSAIQVLGKNLLAAGHSISLWDVKTKTSVRTFTGHPNDISQLESISDDYFASMSYSEGYLRVWSSTEVNCVANLLVSELPKYFHQSSQSSAISVVTEKGNLCIFHHKLNGPIKKPVVPMCTIKILDSNTQQVIPILACYLNNQSGIIVCYGSWLNLKSETFSQEDFINTDNDTVTLYREFYHGHTSKKKRDKESRMEIPNDVKHLQPGGDCDLLIDKTNVGKTKRKASTDEEQNQDELPMEERLSNLTVDLPSSGSIPDGRNLAHLLSQGLHSKDARILQSVLSRWELDMIANTVRSLPVQLIIPLLDEIKKMLAAKSQMNNSLLKWLKSIFYIHSGYLMSCPGTDELLSPYMSLLRTREVLYPQMCQLKGKLELIKGNIDAKEHKEETPNEALLVYKDESTDEEDGEDDAMMPSETEDFLGSDDLGVDDEDAEEEEDEDDDEEEDLGEATTESSSEDDENTSTKKGKIVSQGDEDSDMECDA